MRPFFLIMLALFTLSSCSDDDDSNSNPNTPNQEENNNAVRLINNSAFGNILADADGNTLYFFSTDTKGASTCVDGCLDAWPVFYVENVTLDSGLSQSDFGTTERSDGEMQTTYKGWPLYYFANDNNAGDVNGDGVGQVWYVAKPDYDVMYARAQLIGRDSNGTETNLVIDEQGNYVAGTGETSYIVDDRGNTLYAFAPDTADKNNYTSDGDSNSGSNQLWPVAEIDAAIVPSILDANDFGTIDVFGFTQMTYKRRPIYFFGQDDARGDNFGVGFPQVDIWPIINTETTQAPEADIRLVEDATLGQILVDQEGNTLYFFSDDYTGTTSECEGGCLDAWPIFYADSPSLGAGLDANDFGAVMHPNGNMMTTYKGWPLYYFANDNAPGDTNGEGIGNIWFVAKPDYTVMLVRAQLLGRDSGNNESNIIIDMQGDFVAGTGETFYIVDDYGRTLYGFVNDTNNDNNFTSEDFSNNGIWPIYETAFVTAPSTLAANDFAVIDVFGRQQLTYKGWPLYYFVQDMARGNNFGVGFPSAGVWPTLNQDSSVRP